MKRRDKLVLVGLLSLVVCFGLGQFLSSRDTVEEEPAAPKAAMSAEKRADAWRRLAEKEAPEEVQKVKSFLEKRWGHTGDTGDVAVSVDPAGGKVFFEKDLIVGMGPGGKKVYARAAARPHRFNGPVFTARNRYEFPATITTDKRPIGQLTSKLKPERRPIDSLPGGGFGNRGGKQ